MAKKHNVPDVEAGELAGILRGYGLNPKMFDDLINDAVINQWSSAQFAAELYSSDEFQRMFPGIFNKDGSLKMSPSQYLQMAYGMNGYQDIAKQFGIKVGPKKIGTLIHGNVSPDEWAFKAMVYQQAKATEEYRNEFNQVLEASGGQALSKGDWFNFIARKSHARVENLYEAVALRMADLDISPEAALEAAKAIGAESPTEKVDINAIIGEVRKFKNSIGPELEAAGITDADLAVLQSGGADPRGLSTTLQQILRNREKLVGSGLGGAGRQSQFAPTREGL
jgi:hypothetical protein